MKITELTLSGYKRLMLTNIQHITITPTSIYQLILGTNGSGKSSLLEELSPLPANSKHFISGGYKKISVSHLGEDYELVSQMKSGAGKHSLLHLTSDGKEELNPGGTGQVQKTLVEQIFGITPAIHQLLIGKVKFTSLTPAKRREWITMICSADYSYAVDVYQKLRSGARDAQGALKHTKQRLYNETAKLEGLKDMEGLEKRYTALHQELSVLLQEQNRLTTTLDSLEQQYQTLMEQLHHASVGVMEMTPEIQADNVELDQTSLESVEGRLNDLHTETEVNRALRSRLGKEFQDLSDLINELRANNVEDTENLKEQIAQIDAEDAQKRRALEHYPSLKGDPEAACRAVYEASEQLLVCLKQLPANTDRKFTRQKIEAANKQLDTTKRAVAKSQNVIAGLERQLQHLESLKEERCPKCQHVWVPGKSDREVQRLRTAIQGETRTLEHHQQVLADTQYYLEEADDYRVHFAALKRLTHDHPRLVDLWDVILHDTRLMDDPASLIPDVHAFQREIDIHVDLAQQQAKRERLQTLLNNASQTEGGNEGLEKRLATVQEQLEEVTQTLVALDKEKEKLQRFYRKVKQYYQALERVDDLLTECRVLRDDLIEGERQQALRGVITEHQNELASLQHRRSEKTTLEGIIHDLEKDEQQLSADQKALSLLARTLSPTDGLIAEQLMGFIENFVNHVNQFIASVWTYELKVQGCGVDSGDLDYKFPFTVNDGRGTLAVGDIGEGSEAQLEIINLAFRLVTMLYLKLEEYPLYLDELGRSFDEQHRRNVMDFIKRLTDGANYTQLFMVSHFAAEYGAFTQAEILVLSDSNIAVPQKHNEHVIMA